jgi:hypothetical protein
MDTIQNIALTESAHVTLGLPSACQPESRMIVKILEAQ